MTWSTVINFDWMPEVITIQVGQCGNQIGSRFWAKAYEEQILYGDTYAESFSTFFSETNDGAVKARGVMIDMEPSELV